MTQISRFGIGSISYLPDALRDEFNSIGAVILFFAYSNRMADLMALAPNDEFYSMGRT